jgi:acyl dehydratase
MVPPENNPSYALAYEDYQIGQRIILGSHLLTSEEIIEFANKWDPVPSHTDEKLVLNLRMKLNCCWGTPNCKMHKINTKPRR